jgi:ABC-type sugar transport system ATPase subunit
LNDGRCSSPEARANSFLALSGIGKRFGGTIALDAVDWSVEPGEVHCLVGENGSGKSTLIKISGRRHTPGSRRHRSPSTGWPIRG